MKVVSYWSPEYEGEVEAWEAACDKFAFDHLALPIDNLGSWRNNCGHKPTFLLEQLLSHKEPILWVDIDGRFEAPWDLPFEIADDFDFGIWFIPNNAMKRPHIPLGPKTGHCGLAAGTMFFNYTDFSILFLERWIEAEHGQGKFEQQVLGEVWYRDRPEELRTLRFPQRYCKVDNAPWFDEGGRIVVAHYQASRRLRSVANRNGIHVRRHGQQHRNPVRE